MDITIYGVALIPVISGLAKVFMIAGVPKRFMPILNLFMGIGAGLIYLSNEDWKQGLLLGITIGLGASGLYNGASTLKNGKENGHKGTRSDKEKNNK